MQFRKLQVSIPQSQDDDVVDHLKVKRQDNNSNEKYQKTICK
jgi:hypothetical protein